MTMMLGDDVSAGAAVRRYLVFIVALSGSSHHGVVPLVDNMLASTLGRDCYRWGAGGYCCILYVLGCAQAEPSRARCDRCCDGVAACGHVVTAHLTERRRRASLTSRSVIQPNNTEGPDARRKQARPRPLTSGSILHRYRAGP